MMRRLIWLFLWITPLALHAAQSWQEALSRMPLPANTTLLERMTCIPLMLNCFQSNDQVKALIFLPGATDEFYMFHRAQATLTNGSPTMLDAVNALTSQTYIRATFRPPFLLLHTDEDPLDPLYVIKSSSTAQKLQQRQFVPHALFYDRDWDFLLPTLKKTCKVGFKPWPHTIYSWHFYRHSFAAWNLSAWEGLEAVSLAGKTKFTVGRWTIVFEGDTRVRSELKFSGKGPLIEH